MEILQKINWSKQYDAYQLFINTGKIMNKDVRPIIAESWKRSTDIRPWNIRTGAISEKEFNKLLNENKDLLEIARPVMKYIYTTNNHFYEDNFVQLSEKTGVIMEVAMRACAYPSPIGKRISEEMIGTNLTALVLKEQIPLEVGGTEIYQVCYHSCYGGAAPVKDSEGALLGVLSLYNNFGKIPEQPLAFVEAASDLIGTLLQDKTASSQMVLEENAQFTKMINFIKDYILIVDNEGKIVNVNASCIDLIGQDKDSIIGRACSDYGIVLETIISDSGYGNKDVFEIKTKKQTVSCLLHNNTTVRWLNNKEHTMLLFKETNPPKAHIKTTNVDNTIDSFEKIIGKSNLHQSIIKRATRAAQVPSNVLLDGESGTGKEAIARAIHNASIRKGKPFIAINCGAIPKEILESELFGYEEGAFTGSKKGGQVGKFEAADGGTILLDEIGEMPRAMQVSLLRFLQDKTVTRVGGRSSKKIDVRIMAATNRNLVEQIESGEFRQDLFYRLKVIHITLPPLREKRDDILLIAEYYLEYYTSLYGLNKMVFSQDTKNQLYRYAWPGNIRELANTIENIVVFSDFEEITPDLLPREILEYQPELYDNNKSILEEQEKDIIIRALYSAKGNISVAAKTIGISRNTLYRKIDKYELHNLR